MEYHENTEHNEVNEPPATYTPMKGMKLRVFHSFEEAEEAEAYAVSQQPPLERIRETVELILRTYGVTQEQLNNRRKKLHINILSYE